MWGGLCLQHQLQWRRGLIRGRHSWPINSSSCVGQAMQVWISRQAINADPPADQPSSCRQPAPLSPSHLINAVLAVTTHRGHGDWRLLRNEAWGNSPSQSFCSQNQQGKWYWESGNQPWFGGRGSTLRLQRWFIRNCSASSRSLLKGFNHTALKLFQTFKSEQGTHSH